MNLWLMILLGGAVTYLIRLSFIFLIGRWEMPPLMMRALRYIPPAVLSAIIFPALFMPEGILHLSPTNPRLLAGLLAAGVAWFTRSALITIVAGMAALYLFQFLLV